MHAFGGGDMWIGLTPVIHDLPRNLLPHIVKRNIRQIGRENIEDESRITLANHIAYSEARRWFLSWPV